MSRVALIYDGYGAQGWPVHGPFEPEFLTDAAHGISGTELQVFGHAGELGKLGHDVTIYSRFSKSGVGWQYQRAGAPVGRVAFADLDGPKPECDVAIAYHDARRLEGWPAKLKVALHQTFLVANRQQDATYTGADFADIYITASARVARHLEAAYGWPKVHVVPNAWDLGSFRNWNPIPGRIIYTTSLERGFHRLLEAFPLIRERVPEAHVVAFERGGPAVDALKKSPVDGVTLVRASSRNAVLAELARASVYAYPSDVSSPTECFPVSLLEACATGLPCVVAPDDMIEDIFAPGVMLAPEVKRHPETWRIEFAQRVASVLTRPDVARDLSLRGQRFADPYRFSSTTRLLAEVVGLG